MDSLAHACGNVVKAADCNLRDHYPDAPPKFGSISDEKAYFRERVRSRKRAAPLRHMRRTR